MHSYYLSLSEQHRRLSRWIHSAEDFLCDCPQGTLIINQKRNHCDFYQQESGSKYRKYLRKDDMELVKALAQKEYAKKFLSAAHAKEKDLERLIKKNLSCSAQDMYSPLIHVYTSCSAPRRQLILPYVPPDDELIRSWQAEPYQGGEFRPGQPIFLTERGEQVRSKSEKIIADRYHSLGIPYRYEYPVYLSGLGSVYRDFSLLDLQERVVVGHEHLGMMQKSDYSLKNLCKIDAYRRSGFEIGKDLLLSFESDDHPLDMESFNIMINTRFF